MCKVYLHFATEKVFEWSHNNDRKMVAIFNGFILLKGQYYKNIQAQKPLSLDIYKGVKF